MGKGGCSILKPFLLRRRNLFVCPLDWDELYLTDAIVYGVSCVCVCLNVRDNKIASIDLAEMLSKLLPFCLLLRF